jgi:hypothetical protein
MEAVMDFRISGLSPEPFRHLYGLTDAALVECGVWCCVVDSKSGFPDRVEVRDAEPGERLLLVNYTHQPADGPYRSSHAIFVLEGAEVAYDRVNEVPEALKLRPISLRAFDADHMIVAAELARGDEVEALIHRYLADPATAYLHAHYATRGCYAARIDRA